ncbi:Methyltransferase domain family [Synechococcus sp. PCC 7335]|uniref:class I SAM-dependent methyltransferase n=1 Tax=Synechococcus sp. (strain ATCC 29403 / PCC 7335) TaxID=91464 RepID=UPI00017EB1AA|nr:methyltransferase domain-containing protein [Synechococcus sp. PCC 7335]EDX82862.1 Methyltransferase domain family [Synechococcus sp. PCC 7335]
MIAHEFVTWLSVSPNSRWLDVGCGTGALTAEIVAESKPQIVYGIDPSAERINYANESLPFVKFVVGCAEDIPLNWINFDATVSGLALNLVSDPTLALSNMIRTTRHMGVVAAYCWDFGQGLQMLRYLWNSVESMDSAAMELDPVKRYPLACPKQLKALFESVDLRHIEICAIEVPTLFYDFEDYWSPFIRGPGTTQRYVQSLTEKNRLILRNRLKESLPIQSDGKIHLAAKAWAIKGICCKTREIF